MHLRKLPGAEWVHPGIQGQRTGRDVVMDMVATVLQVLEGAKPLSGQNDKNININNMNTNSSNSNDNVVKQL
jgi:hypothetical protein